MPDRAFWRGQQEIIISLTQFLLFGPSGGKSDAPDSNLIVPKASFDVLFDLFENYEKRWNAFFSNPLGGNRTPWTRI